MAWRCSWVWVWCLGTLANVKWPGEGIYIGHQVHRAVAPMATKNQLSIGWTNATWTQGIGSTGRSNPPGSRWASDALPAADSEPISLTDAMHRWPIGSTGAEESCLYFPTALMSLHRRLALMRHRFNRCWRPDSQSLNMLSGQCPGECTDAPLFLTVVPTGATEISWLGLHALCSMHWCLCVGLTGDYRLGRCRVIG